MSKVLCLNIHHKVYAVCLVYTHIYKCVCVYLLYGINENMYIFTNMYVHVYMCLYMHICENICKYICVYV